MTSPFNADGYDLVLASAPRLQTQPDLASAAAASGDPGQTAQVLAQTADATAMGQALSNHQTHHHSMLGDLWSSIGDAGSSVEHAVTGSLSYLAKPLGAVQHDYRFLHDLWTTSDPLTATLATVGVVAGGVAGGFLGGAVGAELGVDLVAQLEGKLAQGGALGSQSQDIYARTKASHGEPGAEKISPGRDLANLLQVHSTDHGLGKIISGIGDTAFDFSFDPLIKAGNLYKVAKLSPTGLTEVPAAKAFPAYQQWMLDHGFGGIGIQGVAPGQEGISLVDRLNAARGGVWASPTASEALKAGVFVTPYERSLGQLATAVRDNGVGSVTSQFKGYARMAPVIAHATKDLSANAPLGTYMDRIHEAFLSVANSGDLTTANFGYGALPTRTLLRNISTPSVNRIKNIAQTTSAEEGTLRSALNPLSDTTLRAAVAGKVRTYSGYLPLALDPESLAQSGKQINLMSPTSLRPMYDAFRISMGERGAQDAVNEVARHMFGGVDAATGQVVQGNVEAVRTAWINAYKQTVIAAGVPDNSDLVSHVMSRIEQAGSAGDTGRIYGVDPIRGDAASRVRITVPATSGSEIATQEVEAPLALAKHQASVMASLPDYWQITNAVRSLSKVGSVFGSVDQALADQVINKVFKPLALVNSGFALRVALAEQIPAAFRYGALHMLQNRLDATTVQTGYKMDTASQRLLAKANEARENGDEETFLKLTKKIDAGEVGHRLAAISHLVGGASKLSRTSDEEMELLAAVVARHDGHIVFGAGATGESNHLDPINPTDRADRLLFKAATRRVGAIKTGNYTYFNPSQTRSYTDAWHGQMVRWSKEESAQHIAADYLDSYRAGLDVTRSHVDGLNMREANRIRGLNADGTPRVKPHYEEERKLLSRYDPEVQSADAFAADRVGAVRNLFMGADGTFHEDLAQHLANGTHPTMGVLDKIKRSEAPAGMAGVDTIDAIPQSFYATAVSKGFKVLVDPIINKLSREPLMVASLKEQYPSLKSALDRGVFDSHDQMMDVLEYRAIENMLPQIHNVQLRSQFASNVRNVLPFYFAQEQAAKRAVTVISKNPAALREYTMIAHSLADPSFVHVDDQGNRSLMIPLSGVIAPFFLNGAATLGMPVQAGLPLSFTGGMNSLKTVLPELKAPGVSPLVTIPLNEFAKHFPEWSPAVKAVVGEQGFGQPLSGQLIPNALLRNTIKAWNGNTQDRAMANAMQSAITAAALHNQLPTLEQLQNDPGVTQAFLDRIKNNARSILLMKGIIATFSPLAPTPVAEDFGLRDEFYKLVKQKGMTYPQAVQAFIAKHGSASVSYTIAKSTNETGAYIPSTAEAQKFILDNRSLIGSHLSAAYFVPETASGQSADAQVLHNELINMGLREKQTPESFLNQMYIKAGDQVYYAEKKVHDAAIAAATSKDYIKAENAQWTTHVEGMKVANHIWASDFTSPDRNIRAQRIYNDMTQMFATGDAPVSVQTTGIYNLMLDYQQHAQALAAYATSSDRQAERDNWAAYLDKMASDQPALSNVILGVFRRLDKRF